MLKTMEDVKEFIEWASKMGVARAKIGEIEFDIYPTKLIEHSSAYDKATTRTEELSDEQKRLQEEEELFWSSTR